MNKHFTYTGRRTREIVFPLGGIGSGCVGLSGNGRLLDWEIFNQPNKGSLNGFSHFAIKAEAGGRLLDARVLQGDLPPPYSGVVGSTKFSGLGFGPARESMAGLPHFRDTVFRGGFPFAELSFREPKFTGRVTLRAFNPFIPLQEDDSSLPAAFFEVSVTNPTKATITYTVCLAAKNPLPAGQNVNRLRSRGGLKTLTLGSTGLSSRDPRYGELVLATDAASTSHQEYWFRGGGFAALGVYWRDFVAEGRFHNRVYPKPQAGHQDHAVLAAHLRVAPGKTATVRFLLAWHFPHCFNYWTAACDCQPKPKIKTWKNYYARLFPDAGAVAAYALKNWTRLHRETQAFKDALFSSTLPSAALDAISANLSILKSPTVLRLEQGELYGFEGCH
ncbi:MAG: GH116 family glycosyl-hydrolase, partial [Kiritimatiellae bacterium]|nr:GH116 family glycosyl-hydrolase [Kiritimatiellia bacterium]